MHSTWRSGRERAQPVAHRAGRLAADAGIDLVEHERRGAAGARHRHQREHHARELAARRRVAHRRRGDAGVGRDQELDLLRARCRELLARSSSTSNAAPSIASSRQLRAHALRRASAPPSRAPSVSVAGERALAPLGLRQRALRAARSPPRRSRAGRAPPGSARGARAPPRRCRRAFARAGRRRRAAPPPCSSRPGSASSRARVAAQLPAQVLGLDPQAALSRSASASSSASTPGHAGGEPLRLGQQRGGARARRSGAIASAPPALAARSPSRWRSRSRSATSSAFSRRVGLELLDLPDLEHEQVEVALAVAGARRAGPRARAPRSRTRACAAANQHASRAARAAEGVEHLELGADETVSLRCSCWPKKATKPPAELAQVVDRGRPALAGRRASGPSAETRRAEHDLLAVRRLERALDVGLLGAGPHDPRARLAAQQQVERVREHGLARAGLAGDHVQAGAEPELGASRSGAGSGRAARTPTHVPAGAGS